MTALTRGLPIRFLRLDGLGDASDCYASGVVLSAP